MKIFLGIDGGQTTTKSILADETGRILGIGAGGPAIHLKDEETRRHAWQALYESIHAALCEAGLPDGTEIESAFLGFTGVSGPETPAARTYCEVTRDQFRIQSLAIDHDARSALAGAIPSMVGVIVIAGTGSIAFGMNENGQSARAGGWGFLLGDQGSAYEIGRQTLIAVGEAADGIGPKTVLTSLVLEALKIPGPAEMTQVIYRDPAPKLRIAALSAVAAQAAESGDEAARRIFLEGGTRLGEMACAVVRKLHIAEERLSFSAVGGVFQAGELLWKPYCNFVLSQYPASKVVRPEFPPLVGALILAFKNSGLSISGQWLERLTTSYRGLKESN
jgi:N-acetylglucosamine kinase-like BadF-type ATPase